MEDNLNIENITIKKDVSIIFMGTPEFALPILEGLYQNYNIRAIVTQPDKKIGRNGELSISPIKQFALDHTILLLQPENLKEEYMSIIELKPTLIITCAYGQIVPRELLVYPEYGCINVHASLLPKLRGGAPIHRAIMQGYKETGITIMHMNPRLDEGDIISQRKVTIEDDDTTSILHDKLSQIGKELLLETLPSIINKTAPRIPQDSNIATYAFNISKEDEKIDFRNTSRIIYNQIRGLSSYPGAYVIFNGKRIKVYTSKIGENVYTGRLNGQIVKLYNDGIGVKTSNGEIILTEIQPEGKRKMLVSDYLNGLQDKENLIGKIFE